MQIQFDPSTHSNRGGGQWVRALARQAEGWVLESQLRQTQIEKTGSDSSIAKRSTTGVCHWSSEMTIIIQMPSSVTVGVAR